MKLLCTLLLLSTLLGACNKQTSTNATADTSKTAVKYDYDSYWYYGAQKKNGATFLNFNYNGDLTAATDAAYAHNVYSGLSSPTGWQHMQAITPYNNNGNAYMKLAVYHPGGGALPYPKIKIYARRLYSTINSIQTTVVNTVPTFGKLSFNSSYDLYFDKPGQKGANYLAMMVWIKQVGPYGPAGNALSWLENNQLVSETTIDNVKYRLVGRPDFSGHDNIINFVTSTPTDSLTHNTLSLMKFIDGRIFYHKGGALQVSLTGATFADINYGWEIHYAYNNTSDSVNFTLNRFNISIK